MNHYRICIDGRWAVLCGLSAAIVVAASLAGRITGREDMTRTLECVNCTGHYRIVARDLNGLPWIVSASVDDACRVPCVTCQRMVGHTEECPTWDAT